MRLHIVLMDAKDWYAGFFILCQICKLQHDQRRAALSG